MLKQNLRISPSLSQAAVKPVPKEIEHDLGLAAGRVVDRCADTEARKNVLALAQGHLHLRYDVQIGFCSADEIVSGQKLDHRSPDSAVAMILGERLSDCGIQEWRPWSLTRIGREIGAALQLNETPAWKKLPECSER